MLATILCIKPSDTTQNHYNFLVAQPLVYRKSSIAPKSINPNICLRYGDKRFGGSKIVLFCIQYRVNVDVNTKIYFLDLTDNFS